MNALEKEVEKILRNLESEEGHSFKILPQYNLEAASGWLRTVDFVIKDNDVVKYLVECKDVHSPHIQTFQAQMCRAYIELCDLLLKLNRDEAVKKYDFSHPRVRGLVVVRDISYIEGFDDERFDKWADLFHPIGTQFYILEMFRELGLYDITDGFIDGIY